MFGGLKGLEYSLDVDDKLQVDEPSLLFDQYLNTCPNQGSATIRTEVMLISIHDIIRNDSKTSVIHTYIQGRSQTSYTATYNGVVSHGAQIGGLWVFADHTRKNKCETGVSTIFTRCAAFYVFLFVDAGDICTWGATVILITGKTQRPPIWAPCRNKKKIKNGAGLGIYVEMVEK